MARNQSVSRSQSLSLSRSRASRRRGAPGIWKGALLQKLILLHLYSNLSKAEMVRCLRHVTEGKDRSLVNARKKVLSCTELNWRPTTEENRKRRLRFLSKCGESLSRLAAFSSAAGISDHEIEYRSKSKDGTFRSTASIPSATSTTSSDKFLTIRFRMCDAVEGLGEEWSKHSRRVELTLDYKGRGLASVDCELNGVSQSIDDLLCDHIASGSFVTSNKHSLVFRRVGGASINIFDFTDSHPRWCRSVERLSLSRCHIKVPFCDLAHFKNLTHLNLRRNMLESITGLASIPTLEILDVGYNRLSLLPDFLQTNLRKLRALDVSYNRITKLPDWIGHMTQLSHLHVEENSLQTFEDLDLVEYAYHLYKPFCKAKRLDCVMKQATSLLKALLRKRAQSMIWPTGFQQSYSCEICQCTPDPNIDLMTTKEFQTEKSLEINAAHFGQFQDLIACLSRPSLVPASARSSLTVRTFDSLSSNGSKLFASMSQQAIFAAWMKNCCNPRKGSCIHAQVSRWIRDPRANPCAFGTSDLFCNSSLHIAAMFEIPLIKIVEMIDVGVDPNQLNYFNQTFLHLVSDKCWLEDEKTAERLIRRLVLLQFDFTHTDNRGSTVFHTTSYVPTYAHPKVAECEYTSRTLRNSVGCFPFAQCNLSSLGYYSAHAARRVRYNYPEDDCRSDKASRNRSTNVDTKNLSFANAKYLREFSPEPHDLFIGENFPHNCGIEHGLSDFEGSLLVDRIKIVFQGSTDANSYNSEGVTPLMVLLREFGRNCRRLGKSCDTDIQLSLSHLVTTGASVTRQDRAGNTALHYAANYLLPVAMRFLVAANADMYARNDKSVSVLQTLLESLQKHEHNSKAYGYGHQCLVVLMDNGVEVDSSLMPGGDNSVCSGIVNGLRGTDNDSLSTIRHARSNNLEPR